MAYLPNIPKSLLQKPNLNRLASSMNQIVLLKKNKVKVEKWFLKTFLNFFYGQSCKAVIHSSSSSSSSNQGRFICSFANECPLDRN